MDFVFSAGIYIRYMPKYVSGDLSIAISNIFRPTRYE